MADWVPTNKWRAASPGGGSGGFPLECQQTGELGHGKPVNIAQERLGFLFAEAAGVAVPLLELGTHNGRTIGVSKMWGAQSMDVPMVNRVSPDAYTSEAFKSALRRASGLLAYHAWVGTRDLKDEHLMVRQGMNGQYEIAAIDFNDAFSWAAGAGADVTPIAGPPALVANRDAAVVHATVARIEAIPQERVVELVASIPGELLPAPEKQRISTGLIARQGTLHAACQRVGWL